jgi:hypothetical protein
MKRLLVLLLVLVGCGSPAPRAVGNRAGLWRISGSNPPAFNHQALTPTSGALGSFEFPGSGGWVGYVLSSYVGPKPSTITLTYRIDGNAVFDTDFTATNGPAQGCFTPPSVTLIVQTIADDYTEQDGRWWAGTTALVNNAGIVVVSVPVEPSRWTNVMGIPGTQRVSQFADSMANLGHVGMTFGGGCNYGHGVQAASGTSTFTLIAYEVR